MNKIFNEEMSIPRWGVFISDLAFVFLSFFVSYLLRFSFDIPERYFEGIMEFLPMYVSIRVISFLIFKSYSGIIQHTSINDAIRIFFTVISGSLLFSIINFSIYFSKGNFIVPFGVILFDFLALSFMMTAFRIVVKAMYLRLMNSEKELKNVIICGNGEQLIITKKTLERDLNINYCIVGFVNDDNRYNSRKIEGVNVYHSLTDIERLLEKNKVDLLIFSNDRLEKKKKDTVVELCLQNNVKVLTVPPMSSWINGELSFNQMKNIRIEDLLGRAEIELDTEKIRSEVKDRVVLVTGAAGSIGSELVRQLVPFHPKKIFILDQAESPLYELELELKDKFRNANFEVVVADVRNKERMLNVFQTFKPEYVYHAAAYKHVPMMENNPSEAILTNVLGTKITADLAVKFGVEKFVLVSTDKAVNPTNVMGASKRLAEIYVQSLNNEVKKSEKTGTRFVTTRFGNVLGSNGSVIPLFRKQIMAGGPVTVTDPEITRFFMTIPEACQLVLEAGAMGFGGEIFVFDMGESVKIVDLARKMIKLSGLQLGKDIQMVFTGLRPGEKLYEELLNTEENTIPTHHSKILIGKVREYDFTEVKKELTELVGLFGTQNNLEIVTKMKALVPEFRSNNSEFEKLDNKIELN